MVAMILQDDLVKSGEHLIKQLDTLEVTVDAALWLYSSDNETWKLMLSLPEAIKGGPKIAYQKVQKAISKLGEDLHIALDDVTIARIDEPILQLLKRVLKVKKPIRLSNNAFNGQLIEDAYIYRLM